MTIQDFFDKWNNKGCNPDNAYGNQCVDIADQYALEVVNSPLPPVNGAKDFWNKNLTGYEKIPNTPDGVAQLGDIIIWTNGNFGHIAIFKEGDINRFTSFDQNYPTQGYYDNQGNFIGTGICHFQEHNNYNGVAGWFRPKGAITMQPIALTINDQTIINKDLLGWDQDLEVQQIRGLLGDLTRIKGQLKECRDKPPTTPENTPKSFSSPIAKLLYQIAQSLG